MTVDVNFGLIENGSKIAEWDVTENDGTSKKHTVFSGTPLRSFSGKGFYDWVNRIPEAKMILNLCKPNYPKTNDPESRRVDDILLEAIDSLPDDGEPIDIDRATWFKYWSHRAYQEFGVNAHISFS